DVGWMRERSSPSERERPSLSSSSGAGAVDAERASPPTRASSAPGVGRTPTGVRPPRRGTRSVRRRPSRHRAARPLALASLSPPAHGGGHHGGRLLALDEEMGAAVLRPALLRLLGAERALLAVAERAHAGPRDATGEEVLQRGLRAMVAEGEVVFVGAPVVAVAFDQDDGARVVPQPLG